jgi:hypothetical protein
MCLTHLCAASEFRPFDGPRPIAILIESNPWASVIGADTPRVAIYENGDVIYTRRNGHGIGYRYVKLDTNELETVRARIGPIFANKDIESSYDLVRGGTDRPTTMFYFRNGDREIATMVTGMTDGDAELPVRSQSPTVKKSDSFPHALLELHKWLSKLDFAQSKEWSPKYVEVMLWDYSYAPGASIHWPKDWPALNSSRAIKRGDSYSVFLDIPLLPKLREFLATGKKKGAVEIDGKKMAASYRFVFPGEPSWRKAFAAAMIRSDESGGH